VSQQALEAILGRCVLDVDYRALLFADPDQALAGYKLSREERAALLAVDAETLDALANHVGGHLARGERLAQARGETSHSWLRAACWMIWSPHKQMANAAD
jgi:hypothetical protein